MTAYGKKEVFVDALKNHCSGFIEKPFTLEELIEKIEGVRLSTTNERKRGITKAGEQQYRRFVESAPGIFYSFSNKKGESIIHPKSNPFWDNRTMYLFIALLKVWGDMIKVALRKNTIIQNEIQLIYLLFLCCHDTRH